MAASPKKDRPADPQYAVPALEKGLAILEMLAVRGVPLGQNQIAEASGRSVSEIFRVLNCLERLGYLWRDPASGAYTLTFKLFELSHHHPPTEQLIAAALGPMQRWADQAGQSVHLSVLHEQKVLVLAQTQSPKPWSFSVRVGALFPLTRSASGRVLLAFAPEQEVRQRAGQLEDIGGTAAFLDRLKTLRRRGYEQVREETFSGVTDLSVPVFDRHGRAVAALTAPVLLDRTARAELAELTEGLLAAARATTAALGGAAGAAGDGKGRH